MRGLTQEASLHGVRVGETTITEVEIAREMQHHRANDPHRSREEAARALAVRELLRLEVERLGLREVAQPQDDETLEEACVRALLQREITAPHPDDAECRRFFDANRDRLRRSDRLQLRHILLAEPPDDVDGRARARALGEELIVQLRAVPERFDELARRHSACPSRESGGALGWIERGDTTPEFERQVFRLPPGLAGLTVETRWGHHVVLVDAVERGERLDFADAAPRITAYLEAQARQHAVHDYIHRLAERYPVQGLELPAVTS